MASILKPPTVLPERFDTPSIFLAGSIEMGRAEDWQRRIEQVLADDAVTILNPRRDDWDSSWDQSIANPHFAAQVHWELDAQERADCIIMYFAPDTHAPITLLELGLFARSERLVVCCPDGYWRKGNVDVVCTRYGIRQLATLDDLCQYMVTWSRQQR